MKRQRERRNSKKVSKRQKKKRERQKRNKLNKEWKDNRKINKKDKRIYHCSLINKIIIKITTMVQI